MHVLPNTTVESSPQHLRQLCRETTGKSLSDALFDSEEHAGGTAAGCATMYFPVQSTCRMRVCGMLGIHCHTRETETAGVLVPCVLHPGTKGGAILDRQQHGRLANVSQNVLQPLQPCSVYNCPVMQRHG
jgi:hypothetical protein